MPAASPTEIFDRLKKALNEHSLNDLRALLGRDLRLCIGPITEDPFLTRTEAVAILTGWVEDIPDLKVEPAGEARTGEDFFSQALRFRGTATASVDIGGAEISAGDTCDIAADLEVEITRTGRIRFFWVKAKPSATTQE
jgi:hypothetical protein